MVIHNASAINIPVYFAITTYPTRRHHPLQYETPFAKLTITSFYFPRSIYDWNNLSFETFESPSLQLFINKLLCQLAN